MVTDRLIGLSRGAAEKLGIADGVTGVRVRRTNPPAAERRMLSAGEPVRERIATPKSLLAIHRAKEQVFPTPNSRTAVNTASHREPHHGSRRIWDEERQTCNSDGE